MLLQIDLGPMQILRMDTRSRAGQAQFLLHVAETQKSVADYVPFHQNVGGRKTPWLSLVRSKL